MHNLICAYPLYNFLKYCNNSTLEKNVLDCGAGGSNPPLSIFYEFGYKTHGIEISEEQLEKASQFCKVQRMDLDIINGDMRNIPFVNEFFSFLFSYNTSVHMRKKDFGFAFVEFLRVLKHDGLCYVNFLSEECSSYGNGTQISDGEFIQIEDAEEVLYSHYKDKEPEKYFDGFDIVYKEKRIVQKKIENEIITSGYLDYILMKI
jgi:SAM-dependent methyltransferase